MVEIFVSTSQGSKETSDASQDSEKGRTCRGERSKEVREVANRLCSNLTFRNQRKSEVVLWIFRVRFLCVCVCGRGRGHEAVQFVYEKGIAHKGRNACPDLRKFDG